MRVANSSYYGHPRSITTMERALLLLGRDAVRSIAAATCFDRTMARGTKGTAIDMQAVARHSLTTAAAAEALATIARQPMASEAFIAGLLHNLGMAVQVHLDPRGIDAMIDAYRYRAACGIRVLESKPGTRDRPVPRAGAGADGTTFTSNTLAGPDKRGS